MPKYNTERVSVQQKGVGMMRQKGFGKKVLSLVLAAAMSISLCAPAWAEGADAEPAANGYTQQEGDATPETGKADDTSVNDAVISGVPAISMDVPASAAVAQVGDTYYATLADAISNAAENATVVLLKDVEETVAVPDAKKVTLDLNNKVLTILNDTSITVTGGANVTIQNGTVIAKQIPLGTVSLFNIQKDSSICLNKVQMDTTGAALYPQGDAARVEVTDSSITAGSYAVATNAATGENYNVEIILKNSAFDCTRYGYNADYRNDACAVLINVPGKLEIEGCNIIGSRQGMIVRGGEAVVRNSTIVSTGKYTEGIGQYIDTNWGSGNEVPMAAVVVGNRSTSYPYLSTCMLIDCTITSQNSQVPAVYANGAEEYGSAVIITGEDTKVHGNILLNGRLTAYVDGGYYTQFIPDYWIRDINKTCILLDSLYEGVYSYQIVSKSEVPEESVVGVNPQPADPEAEVVEIDADAIPDVVENKAELVDQINLAANSISVSEESKTVVSGAALVEAKVEGQKINSQAVKGIATEALESNLEAGDSLQDDSVITITVTPVLKIEPQAPVVKEGALAGVSFDIQLQYQVTAKATTEKGKEVKAELLDKDNLPNVVNPPVMDMTIPNIPVYALGCAETDPEEAIASDLYVRHEHEGSVFYYNTIVTKAQEQNTVSVSFTNEHGFSVFTVGKYSDKATVQYPWGNIEYVVTDIGTALPTAAKDGYTFKGWTFAGVAGGPYLTMTEELLGKLAQAYSAAGSNAVAASAVFSQNVSDVDKEEEVGSQPAATPAPTAAPQQSGSNITYYTCPACGYHDWTATAEGYKCNHCGYLESVKQLSGYGNVKGVYEPKTSAAAAASAGNSVAASAIPQTSDDLPLTALMVVAIAALVGLGIVIVMKKRNKR